MQILNSFQLELSSNFLLKQLKVQNILDGLIPYYTYIF